MSCLTTARWDSVSVSILLHNVKRKPVTYSNPCAEFLSPAMLFVRRTYHHLRLMGDTTSTIREYRSLKVTFYRFPEGLCLSCSFLCFLYSSWCYWLGVVLPKTLVLLHDYYSLQTTEPVSIDTAHSDHVEMKIYWLEDFSSSKYWARLERGSPIGGCLYCRV